ncbi:hypothetical protein BS50DRAFT_267089 [Corynespora cassiicola Philippines]|uniref:Cytochrome b561 domain-containing protein n=1 Tax=Corynespora cassiicola Philippines TaxID=1448308 RepID=A0A2T2NZ97_CORCC|nr:hypothetical protein BS50DRAFT_267089 [Corynespora cassiicola Philippines]
MDIGSTEDINNTLALIRNAQIAHGVIASLAIVVWFPLGVFILRTLKMKNTVRFHAMWQCVGLILLLVGFGLGSWMSSLMGGLYGEAHVILGIVITILFLVSAIFGYLHHKNFLRTQSPTHERHIHVWLGRFLLILGLINGGTGLKLADNTTAGGIVYGVVAGLVGITYAGVWYWSKRQRNEREPVAEATGQQKNDGVAGDSNAVEMT